MSRGRGGDETVVTLELDTAARVWERTVYGARRCLAIRPAEFGCVRLACELAGKWAEIAPELPGSAEEISAAVRGFLRFVDRTWPEDAPGMSCDGLGRGHLDAWEACLAAQQRGHRTDTPYRRAIYLFALLRRIEDDTPGTLQPDVAQRLRHETWLQHIRRPPDPEFTVAERQLMTYAASQLITPALHAARAGAAAPHPDVLVAVHIQLALATGEPPEVLRQLTIDDLALTPARPGEVPAGLPADDVKAVLARTGNIRELAVSLTKRRSSQVYLAVYGRRDREAISAFSALVELTAPTRAAASSRSLWLVRRDGSASQAAWDDGTFSLRRWVQRHVRDADGEPATVSDPVVFRRFRKTVTGEEVLQDPARYLRSRHRHSPRTFFGHYAASPVLRAEAGKILLAAVSEQFEAATAGPLVITPEAEQLLAEGQETAVVDALTGKQLAAGKLDTPVAACRDPLNSPHAPPGSPCPVFANGQCFGCRNALITRHHLPAAVALADRIHPDRAPDRQLWKRHWAGIYEFLTTIVLPAFPAQDVAAARESARAVLLDSGLLNDLGTTYAP